MTIPIQCPHCHANTTVAEQAMGRIVPCGECGHFITIGSGNRGSTPRPDDSDVFYIDDNRWKLRWDRSICFLKYGLAILYVVLIVAGFLYMAMISGPPGIEEIRRSRCRNNLKQIALALHCYHDTYDCFPPAYVTDQSGRPMHSWRVYLLEFIEPWDLHTKYDFSEPWDSPNNMRVLQQMPDVYRCPWSEPDCDLTHYVVVVGDPERFPETMFTPDRGIRLTDIRDGAFETIMVVHVRQGVLWTSPTADLRYDRMTFRIDAGPESIGCQHGEPHVAFADGGVSPIPMDFDPESLRNLIQPAEGQIVTNIPR